MSVIHFSAGELGNIARTLAPGASDDDKRSLIFYSEQLEIISQANVAAYIETYEDRHGTPKAHTASEIRAAAPSPVKIQPRRACEDITSLEYNSISNGGKFAPGLNPARVNAAFTHVMGALLRKVSKRAYPERAREEIIPENTPGQPMSLMSLIPPRAAPAPKPEPDRDPAHDLPF